VVGRMVGWCIENKRALTSLTVDELKTFDPAFGNDALKLFDWQTALAGRDIQGGTGPRSVKAQIKKARKLVGKA
jgi:argininosuccinate lyase